MPESEKSYVQEMLLALEANIEFLKQEGSSQLTIRNGRFLNSIGENFLYEFSLDFFQDIEPDAEVEIRVKRENATGKVVAVTDKIIQVQINKNLGSVIPEGRLVISSYYLLQLLIDKLKAVESGEFTLTDFAEKAFGIKSASINIEEEYVIPDSKTIRANKSQEAAIRLSLGSEVSFIWGPPGTGKTKTIARIIEGFINMGKSVLLLSHTNIATDGALKDFVEHLIDTDDYRNGKFLRVGDIQKDELKDEKYSLVILQNAIAKQGEPLRTELDRLNKELDLIAVDVSKSQSIVKLFEKQSEIKKEIENTVGYANSRVKELKLSKEYLVEKKNELLEIDLKIKQYNTKGTFGRLFSFGMSIEKLTKNKAGVLIDISKGEDKIKANQESIDSSSIKYNNFLGAIKEVDAQLEGVIFADHENLLVSKKKEEEDLKKQKAALLKALDELSVSLIKDAKVIATTLTKSYSSKVILEREYDCVIIDEASMAPLPALWCAAGLAKQNVVVVGDFWQLPPVLKHRAIHNKTKPKEEVEKEEEFVRKWLASDIFKIVGITNAIEKGESPAWLRQLNTQYRMHPDIADVINRFVYDKGNGKFKLASGENTKENGIKLVDKKPLEGAHIGVYDTSCIGSIANRTDGGSYYNFYHAFLSVELARQALESGYESVGIISPFRPQTNLIQKILEDCGLNDTVAADTVHRFQGGEKDVIIFDVSTPQPTKLTDDQEEGGDDDKLINVAFSRAKTKCILVVDVNVVEKKHSETSLIKKIIHYCKEKELPICSTQDILSKFSVAEKSEKWLEKINNINDVTEFLNSSVFEEGDFYPQFYRDLLSAKQEVIIDSPYITSERMRMMMPVFENLRARNINIFIITRNTEDHTSSMRAQANTEFKKMEEIGIVILPFKGNMHRKLAVIDRNITWEGSLNILSQRESQEFMRRFVGPQTANQLIALFKWDKNIGKIGENNLVKCEFCDKPGSWYWTDLSRFGMWTFCLTGMHKKGGQPKTEQEKEERKQAVAKIKKIKKEFTSDGTPVCPEHDILMVKKKGRFGEFWGCPKYPYCKVTEKIK
jgi:superfamily I DNA and/or RNA helicase/ssDNA-binding Zn-finger/Zn-ribbon topoisomerase 1